MGGRLFNDEENLWDQTRAGQADASNEIQCTTCLLRFSIAYTGHLQKSTTLIFKEGRETSAAAIYS